MQAKRRQTGFWVPAREAFWLALEELRNHKLRSFLTCWEWSCHHHADCGDVVVTA